MHNSLPPSVGNTQGSGSTASLTPFSVLRLGFQLVRCNVALRKRMLKGLGVNMAVFVVIITGLNLLLYYYGLAPLRAYFGSANTVTTVLFDILLLLLQLAVGSVLAFYAFRLSLMLSSLWHDALAADVIAGFRSLPQASPGLSARMGGFLRSLGSGLRDVFITVLLLLCSFIPVAGIAIVFAGESLLNGKSTLDPYRNVLQAAGEDTRSLYRTFHWRSVALGIIPTALAFIPIIGWLLIPPVMFLQVLGASWILESERSVRHSS